MVEANAETTGVDNNKLVIVGQILSPFKLSGWQHFSSFTAPIDNIFSYKKWYVLQSGKWSEIELTENKRHNKGLIVKFAGIEDRTAAQAFTNCKIAVPRSELPETADNEFYWADLEGLTALNQAGEVIGKVSHLYEGTNLDILVVKNNQDEKHIPFKFNETVISVDLNQQNIVVDWGY